MIREWLPLLPFTVRTSDGTKDQVDCGPGRDSAVLDSRDRQRRCESRRRVAASS